VDEYPAHLIFAEHHGQAAWLMGVHQTLQAAHIPTEYGEIDEKQGGQSLILTGGGQLFLQRQGG